MDLSKLTDEQLSVYRDLLIKKQAANDPTSTDPIAQKFAPPTPQQAPKPEALTAPGAVPTSASLNPFGNPNADKVPGTPQDMGIPAADAFLGMTSLGSGAAVGASKILPSMERAGENFGRVSEIAGSTPINPTGPLQRAIEAKKLQDAGGWMPAVMSKFIDRVADVDKGPITYDEARSFQKVASKLSASDRQSLVGEMGHHLSNFRSELRNAIQDAAESHGMGDEYDAAMNEYHKAAQVRGIVERAKDLVTNHILNAAAAGAGAAGAWKAFKNILGE